MKMTPLTPQWWMDDALCTQGQEAVFCESSNARVTDAQVLRARAICGACPVINQCRRHAHHLGATATRGMIWAGQTTKQRRRQEEAKEGVKAA